FYLSVGGVVKSEQSGVLRVNCLDCLDRTNAVQTVVGLLAVRTLVNLTHLCDPYPNRCKNLIGVRVPPQFYNVCILDMVVRDQVASLGLEKGKVNVEQRIEEIFRDLWQKNGDLCSNIYAGTGALDGKSKFKDASRSLARTIQNNLMDTSKQESFDLFLSGTYYDNRIFDRVANLLPSQILQDDFYFYGMFCVKCEEAVDQVISRIDEVTTPNPIRIFVGTWNVNGGKNMQNIAFRNQSNMADWIFPNGTLVHVDNIDEAPEIIAIGVEELVDLNASNLVKARYALGCPLFYSE
ncbi:hypothetical protein OESDEN_20264, partial [Oesophagostomum dentatum]